MAAMPAASQITLDAAAKSRSSGEGDLRLRRRRARAARPAFVLEAMSLVEARGLEPQPDHDKDNRSSTTRYAPAGTEGAGGGMPASTSALPAVVARLPGRLPGGRGLAQDRLARCRGSSSAPNAAARAVVAQRIEAGRAARPSSSRPCRRPWQPCPARSRRRLLRRPITAERVSLEGSSGPQERARLGLPHAPCGPRDR